MMKKNKVSISSGISLEGDAKAPVAYPDAFHVSCAQMWMVQWTGDREQRAG